MKYGKNDIEWQTSIQGMSLSDLKDYLQKRTGSFKHQVEYVGLAPQNDNGWCIVMH